MSDAKLSAESVEERARYYEAWAADIRRLNGHSVDADHADATASVLRALQSEADAARAEAARLREALAPFAKEAARWPEYVPDGDFLFIASPDDVEPLLDEQAAEQGRVSCGISYSTDTVTVGDLRRAALAVEEPPHD